MGEQSPIIPEERTSLSVHVQMCEQRHKLTNARLTRIEVAAYLILGALAGGGYLGVRELAPALQGLRAAYAGPLLDHTGAPK